MTHTPGDWILVENPDGLPYITDQQRRVIAFIRDMGADTDGNAALIRAAPKLLLMLEEFAKINASGEYEFDTNEPRLYKAIVNAIAEAKRTVSNGN